MLEMSLKERIFISNIDMNAQHKSSFYKFVGGPRGGGGTGCGNSMFGPPNFSLGGHGPFGPSLDPPLTIRQVGVRKAILRFDIRCLCWTCIE